MNRAPGSALLEEEFASTDSTSEGAGDPAPSERRRFPRIAPPRDASVRLRAGVPARLLDLGLGGALIESSARLVPGSLTGVTLRAGDLDFRTRMRVRRASITGLVPALQGERLLIYRAGLEFGSLSPTELDAVRAVLDPASTTVQPAPLPSVRFPPGWATTRKKSVIVAREPNEQGFVFLRALSGGPNPDLCEFAQVSMRDAGFSAMHWRPAEINGLPACVGFYHGWLDPIGAVIAEAAHVVLQSQTYLLAGVADWTAYERLRHEFFTTIGSFGRPPAPESAGLILKGGPAPEASQDSVSRRRHIRVAGPFDGYRVDLLETPVRIYDLGEGGCFVNALHDTTTKGQRFGLKILLPSEGWITVEAETIYNRPEFGFAVRFHKLPEHTRVRLARALKKLQARRTALEP